ncbi:PREDICTED: dentin sialophosphoprotein-like [Priapulus caudatus]|uniref:Dentin sialophosphoprotein-like n=1 Tax=Priapulus caudatus TaxID=37621 RepID=A0ABM1EIX2_PRICU|nr:PREDICTED: dentin sialophosphoprotein-like [Priapulus caudatus]
MAESWLAPDQRRERHSIGEDDDDNTVGADSDDGGKDDADNTVGADSDDGGEDDNDDTGEDDTSEINADDVNESANSNIDSRSSSQDADETETVNVGSLVDKMTGNDGKNDDTGSDSGNDASNDGDTSSNSDDDDVPADGSDDVPSNPRFSPVMMAEERARRRPADWQEWGAWSECTACGGCGSRQRSRECMLGARGQTLYWNDILVKMKASAGLLAFIIVSAVASAHAQDITTESSQSADDRLVNATVLPVPAEEGEATLSNSTDNNITTTTQSSSTPVGGVGDRDDSDTDNDGVVQPVTAGPGSGNHAFIRDSIAVEDTILSPTEGAIVEGEADESVSPSEEQSAADSDDSNRQAPDLFPSSQETNTETSTVHEEPRTDSNPSSEGSTDAAVNHGTGATVDDSKPSITGRGNRKTKKYFEQIGPLRAHVSGGDENVVGSRGDISRDQSLVDDSVDADSDDNIETRVIEPLSVSAGDDTHNSSTAEGDGTGIDDNNVDDDLQSSRTTEGDGTDTDDNIVVDETHGSSTTRSDDANNDDSNVAPPQDDDVSAQRSNGAGLGRGSAVIEDTIVSPTDGVVGSDNADDNSRSYNVSEEYSTGDDVTNSNGQKTDVSRSPQNTNKEMHDPKPDTDAYPPPEDSTDASTETVDVIRQTKGRYFDQIGPLGAKLIEGEDDTDGDADNTVGADSDDGGEDDDDNTVGADSDDGGEDDDDNTVGADSDDGVAVGVDSGFLVCVRARAWAVTIVNGVVVIVDGVVIMVIGVVVFVIGVAATAAISDFRV